MKVLDETPGGGPARIDAGLAASPSSPSALRDRLDRLHERDGAALREEWRRFCRSEPLRISRDLLMRAIAYRVQELEFGGLPKWARQSLLGSANESDPADAEREPGPKPAEPSPLKPGARLVREWHGRTHVVTVVGDAFEFEGRRYGSLTQIACEITGAHWSGPRFFGLTKRRAAPLSDAAQAPPADATEAGDLNLRGPGEPKIEPRQDAAGAEGSDGSPLRRERRPSPRSTSKRQRR